MLGIVLLVGSLIAAFCLSTGFGLAAAAYAALLIAYSVWLKHLVILDVLTVAAGFVLRAVAGAEAIAVEISGWLVICTILVALFLALGKRRHEYRTLKGDAAAHRPILAEYSESFLDQMVAVVTASTVTAYALYTMSPETVAKFNTRLLPVTLPFVLYGIFRYLYLLYRREMAATPPTSAQRPAHSLVNTGLWMLALLVIIYGPVWGPAGSRAGRLILGDAGLPLEEVAGWGRHPVGRAGWTAPGSRAAAGRGAVIARGLGRAYGDAAMPAAPGGLVVERTRADRILAFDGDTGRLHCEAGLSLADILTVFLPRGWFPPVTPGTKFVTVGACVACDVHGKNHHRDGSFGRFVDRLVLVTADGKRVECGPAHERELFLATVGGMGLTGLIVEVTLRLRRVESPWIVLETVGVEGLEAMLAGLKRSAPDWSYTVGWIDCLARGSAVGRGILMRGRHATPMEAAGRRLPRGLPLTVPVDAPEWLLNQLFRRVQLPLLPLHGGALKRRGSPRRFFYPLDAVGQWNRLRRRGFLQYQSSAARGRAPRR